VMDPQSRVLNAVREYPRDSAGVTAKEIARLTRVPLSRVRVELKGFADRGTVLRDRLARAPDGSFLYKPGPRDLVAQGRGI
jgi:DNA-binding IclR family transcriptional regulator